MPAALPADSSPRASRRASRSAAHRQLLHHHRLVQRRAEPDRLLSQGGATHVGADRLEATTGRSARDRAKTQVPETVTTFKMTEMRVSFSRFARRWAAKFP